MTAIAPGLLPEGLHDRLPPEAEAAATLLRAVMDVTASHGYDRVQPPLAEFEANLVGRLKSTRQQDLLRFVDPVSQRRSEEHTSELQSLMRISYAVFCLKKKK